MINDAARGTGHTMAQSISAVGGGTLPPHPARGVAKVIIGPRSGLRIPEGPPVDLALSVDELELVLTRLKESA